MCPRCTIVVNVDCAVDRGVGRRREAFGDAFFSTSRAHIVGVH